MASLPLVVWLPLEMVKGNHSMIKSYISDRVPLSLLREEGGCRLPLWIFLTGSETQLLHASPVNVMVMLPCMLR